MSDDASLGPAAGPSDPVPQPGVPGRAEGLAIETCYRHPTVTTGVHCTRCGRPICTECMRPAAVGYQCLECLKEARHSMPRSRRRLTVGGMGPVTRVILAANVAMFVVELVAGGLNNLFGGPGGLTLIRLGALYPPNIAEGQYWRLLTAMFLHAGLLHIGLNMWALYLFGTLVEDAYGRARFLALYLVSGFFASVTSFAFGPLISIGVGASGAIFGLLGAWFAYNYRRREMRFHRAQLQSAMTLIALNLVLSFSLSRYIDWRAHVGGLVAGAILGFTAEGFGAGATRRAVQVGGFVVVLAVGVTLAIAHAHSIAPLARQLFV